MQKCSLSAPLFNTLQFKPSQPFHTSSLVSFRLACLSRHSFRIFGPNNHPDSFESIQLIRIWHRSEHIRSIDLVPSRVRQKQNRGTDPASLVLGPTRKSLSWHWIDRPLHQAYFAPASSQYTFSCAFESSRVFFTAKSQSAKHIQESHCHAV